jgi:hypothetical protein
MILTPGGPDDISALSAERIQDAVDEGRYHRQKDKENGAESAESVQAALDLARVIPYVPRPKN